MLFTENAQFCFHSRAMLSKIPKSMALYEI